MGWEVGVWAGGWMEVDRGRLVDGWMDGSMHEGINGSSDSSQKLASLDHLRRALKLA